MARILLVDDDRPMRYLINRILVADKHHVFEAVNGQEALTLMDKQEPDLVLTDICMPEMDGTEFIITLRKRWPAMPVIAMSGGQRALNSQFTLASARMAGTEQLLNKPFEPEELRTAIRRCLLI
ncbi:response regulator [Vreelandella aquamarina]